MFRSGSPRKEKNLVHTWLQVTLDIAYGYHDLVMILGFQLTTQILRGDGGIIGHGNNPEHAVYPRELPPLGPSSSWQPQRRPGNNEGEYINVPASAAVTKGVARPLAAGVAMGAGVGRALAAAAVIFGDDFMSGFSIPPSLQDPSLTISMDPTF
ncbi:unnamed protein product [Linum trigynum]|uniref:Uncharacterized protein n=1 Tax=Linum trigynum TaxID=586398 RepID=A0AAV2GEL8_9ROSI